MKSILSIALCLLISIASVGQSQRSEDDYTRYELLDPATKSFRIVYDVSAATPGAQYYFNGLRKGSEHKVDAVTDRMTGKKLEWTIVNSIEAKKTGYAEAATDGEYLKIKLLSPVPIGGETRIRIDKTYTDAASYFTKDDKIVFDRSLGIKRNSIVLPLGYELIKCNYPSQVAMERDGKIKVSFIHTNPEAVPFHLEAKKLMVPKAPAQAKLKANESQPIGQGRDKSKARLNFDFAERANQTREIVYFLQQPETNSFRLYHDYTEEREGKDRYINVVRAGSKASNPSAKMLDTGKELKVETLQGEAITKRGLDIGEPVAVETEVVAIWFDAVEKGETARLRIEETYTDKNRYMLYENEFIFDRSFGRPFNTVVLPDGWFLTANSVPATVDIWEGKVSLYFINDAPEEIDVYIKGMKR